MWQNTGIVAYQWVLIHSSECLLLKDYASLFSLCLAEISTALPFKGTFFINSLLIVVSYSI